MKNWKFLLLTLLFLGAGFSIQAQSSSLYKPRLYIKGNTQQPQYIEISYEVNYGGFVELHLFDSEGKKLWVKGKITDKPGIDALRIPRKPLEDGKRYTYTLKYKGQDYNGSFYPG